MALPEDDWLPQAKRLAIGMRMRVHHRNERRSNMVIGNEGDRYWAYCQACKEGGVLEKEHVLLGHAMRPTKAPADAPPTDLTRVLGSEWETIVGRFLASKDMMFPYLPELWVSPSERRMFLHDGFAWHSRDLTERSPAKWLHYQTKFSGDVRAGDTAIVTEDIFSMYKTRYALLNLTLDPAVQVCCSLGASAGPATVLGLQHARRIIWFYDGDKAGDDGFRQASKRMRPFVQDQRRARPPEGKDPKNITCPDIRDVLKGVL